MGNPRYVAQTGSLLYRRLATGFLALGLSQLVNRGPVA
jgi:hypothetical protein